MEYLPHTGFHYSKLLIYLSYDYSSFSNISGMDVGGSEYRQVCLLSKLDTWLDYLSFSVNVLPKGGTLKSNLFDFYIFCIYSLFIK